MEDIERRALMGDRKAQDECTRIGIVLPCPCCGNESVFYDESVGDYDYGYGGYRCYDCDLGQGYNFKTEEEALASWNRRTAPPIGRCMNCSSWDKEHSSGRESLGNYVCVCHEWSDEEDGHFRYTPPDGFCNNFEPMEEPKNEN